MEAELGTCQTKIALLKSKDKIGEKERELLNHDLENVERALGNVLERMSVLESGENATFKKRLAETETKLVWARMKRDTAERRLHESRVWNKMFYLDMVRIVAISKPLSDDEDTERPRTKSKNSTSDGTDGPFEPFSRTSLLELYNIRWIMPPKAMSEARMREVIMEQVAASMAEFMATMNREAGGNEAGGVRAGGGGAGGGGAGGGGAGGAGAGGARAGGAGAGGAGAGGARAGGLIHGIDAANGTPWAGVRKWMTEEFCPRSVLQRLEQELMMEPEQVKVEQYICGLSKNIRGDVTSSRPASINEAVRMAYQLMRQIIQDKTDEASEGEKMKGEGDRGGRGDNRRDYNRRQNQRRANAGAMTNVAPNDNEVCPKCKNKKHAGDCWRSRKIDCLSCKRTLGTRWSTLIDIEPVELDTCYEVELADGKVVRIPLEGKTLVIEGDRNNSRLKIVSCIKAQKYIEKGCELFLAQVTGTRIDREAIIHGIDKNKPYAWGDDKEEAFQTLKLKLCSAPILSLPEGREGFVVYCDASLNGFGAVLMQREKVKFEDEMVQVTKFGKWNSNEEPPLRKKKVNARSFVDVEDEGSTSVSPSTVVERQAPIPIVEEKTIESKKKRWFWSTSNLGRLGIVDGLDGTESGYQGRCLGEVCITRSSTKELYTPFKDQKREFYSSRKLFMTLSLDESRSPAFDLFFDLEENSKEEVVETMAKTKEEYMSKTRADYGSGVTRTKIDDKDHFELKG
ncbi:putative reverse transcriptase domain-containing protein [Tanacetum coccineum]